MIENTHNISPHFWKENIGKIAGRAHDQYPGAFPRTSTFALTNATFPYVLQIADKGYKKAMEENAALRKGLNVMDGQVAYQAVAERFGLAFMQNPFSFRSLKKPS